MRRVRGYLLVFLIGFLCLPGAASAKGIFEHQNSFVPENQTVNDVIVIGGDATIAGTVDSSVVVINGNVHIQSTAHVHGFVLVVGGQLQQDAGAELTDDVINISFDKATMNSLIIGGGLVVGIAALKLALTLLTFLLPIAMTVFGKGKTAAFVLRFRGASRSKLIYAGLFTLLMFTAISLLLLLSIAGIPLILVFAAIILVATAFGLTVLSQLIGEQIQGASGKAGWIKTASGAFVLAASVNIPFAGLLLWLAITSYSLGIAVFWATGKMRRNNKS